MSDDRAARLTLEQQPAQRPYAALWSECPGYSPGPSLPNALAWSESNLLAFTCGRAVHLVDASQPRALRGMLRAESVLQSQELSLKVRKMARRTGSGHSQLAAGEVAWASVCAPRAEDLQFRALSWSPIGSSRRPAQCLLCVSIGEITAVYEAPESVFDVMWVQAVQLGSLLALAESACSVGATATVRDERGDTETPEVHSSSWAAIPPRACPAASLLALGGPRLLCVLRHVPQPLRSTHTPQRIDEWSVALSLPIADGVSCVHLSQHVKTGGGGVSSASHAFMLLFAGLLNGAVGVTCLSVRRQDVGGEPSVHAISTMSVCAADFRPVAAMSSLPFPVASAAEHVLVVGRGQFVRVLRLLFAPGTMDAATALAAGTAANGSISSIEHSHSEGGRAGQLHIELLCEASHTGAVTGVLCLPSRWLSCSRDTTVLTGTHHVQLSGAASREETPLLVETLLLPRLRAQEALYGTDEETAAARRTTSREQPPLYGVAAAHIGGAVSFVQTVNVDSSATTRFDVQWRLLSTVLDPADTQLGAQMLLELASSRAPGASLWPLSLLLQTMSAAERLRALRAFEQRLLELPPLARSRHGLLDAAALPAWQMLTTLAHLCERLLRPAHKAARSRAGGFSECELATEVEFGHLLSRCHARLLRTQAISLLDTSANATPAERARAAAYLAAYWASQPQIERTCEQAAVELKAARSQEEAAGSEQTGAVQHIGGACYLCGKAAGFRSSLEAVCEDGHSLLRCWLCFGLLPVHSWSCGTCGAGCCQSHDADGRHGLLASLVPAGHCGLCGAGCLCKLA